MHNATHGQIEKLKFPSGACKKQLTFESDSVAENLEELVKERRVVIVVEDLFLCVLALFHVYDTHFQFRLDENLRQRDIFRILAHFPAVIREHAFSPGRKSFQQNLPHQRKMLLKRSTTKRNLMRA
jgi:hypothetical protein